MNCGYYLHVVVRVFWQLKFYTWPFKCSLGNRVFADFTGTGLEGLANGGSFSRVRVHTLKEISNSRPFQDFLKVLRRKIKALFHSLLCDMQSHKTTDSLTLIGNGRIPK